MKFVGKGQPLTRGSEQAMALLGLGVNNAAYIWTVVDVETAGRTQGFGFRVDRRPQNLLERHMFRKNVRMAASMARPPDISGAGGYGLLSEQYAKPEKALSVYAKAKLGFEPALKSASWAWVR